MKTALLRAQIEQTLRSKISAPFSARQPAPAETVASGIPEIDRLTGGLPRGCLTEICGPVGCGRTSLLVSLLASLSNRKESCALVDARDSFDPCGAEAAGVALERLLLVRCTHIEQALRATDLLLHGGGFGLVALDLSDLPVSSVRRVPLNVWFRFRRMVENTPAIFMLLEQESCAKTCASLVLQLEMKTAHWRSLPKTGRDESLRQNSQQNSERALLSSLQFSAEVVRCRFDRIETDEKMPRDSSAQDISKEGAFCHFESSPAWNKLAAKQKRLESGAFPTSRRRFAT